MKAVFESTGKPVVIAGVKFDKTPVTVEETPEHCYFVAMGWLRRAEKRETVAADEKPASTPVKRRKRG